MPPRDQRSFEAHNERSVEVPNQQRNTILLVDDEPSILVIRRLVFETRGYTVLTAASGKEALEIMGKSPVDVVILDYRMPEMDGEATAMEIRRLHGDVPIILSTGCISLPRALVELVNVSVHKGLGPKTLIDAVERRLHSIQPAKQQEKRPSAPAIADITSLWRKGYSFSRS